MDEHECLACSLACDTNFDLTNKTLGRGHQKFFHEATRKDSQSVVCDGKFYRNTRYKWCRFHS